MLREHKQVTHTIETLLQPVKEITSVSEVQLYYHDDGRIKIKVTSSIMILNMVNCGYLHFF